MNNIESLLKRIKKAQEKRDSEQQKIQKKMLKNAQNIAKLWNAWAYLLERELKK